MYQKANEVVGLLANEAVKIEEHFVTLFEPPLNVLSIIIRTDSSNIVKTRLVAPNYVS